MKKSYQLLGLPWDGMAETAHMPACVVPFDAAIAPLGADPRLFDGSNIRRTLTLSRCLRINTDDELHVLEMELRCCTDIFLILDYLPSASGIAHHDFFRQRLRQIVAFVQASNPETRVSFMEPAPNLTIPPERHNSLLWFMQLVDVYSEYLLRHGVKLMNNGFPVLRADWFIDEVPQQVAPYSNRNNTLVHAPEKTLLVHYAPDSANYPRLRNVLADIPEYRKFLGSAGTDVTVTADMDPQWQAETMLANHLFMAMLGVNGVKIAANLRTGGAGTLDLLAGVPRNVTCISSSFGCAPVANSQDLQYAAKVSAVLPSRMLQYGKVDKIANAQLDTLGISHKEYKDMHRLYA